MLAATGKTPTDNEVESLFKKGDLDGNGKTTEKVVRVQAPQEISYRALNDQQNGLEVSKVIFINKREGLQRNTILCLKQVWRQNVVFRMIFCLEHLV